MITRSLFDFPRFGWRSPFTELERLRRDIDRLTSGSVLQQLSSGVFPAVNLTETKDHYFIRAELPGLTAEDLDIQTAGNSVTISGERKIAAEEGVRYHRREREAGKFSRVITLPEVADMGKVEAGLVNGILTVKISKSEAAKPRQISVK